MNDLDPHLRQTKPAILHVCHREMLRPLRDQILRRSGYEVDSTLLAGEALSMFYARHYDLVLIDVEGEDGVSEAEHLCSEIRTARHHPLVAFVCNWRVANLTDCPDEIVRADFNPAAFVEGVRQAIQKPSRVTTLPPPVKGAAEDTCSAALPRPARF